jgi:putative heme iron utilization protein
VLTPTEDAGELVAAEPAVLAHMNEDHGEACRLYATKLLGAPDGAWRCVGCDPEGLELQLDRMALRLPFPQRVRAPDVLRQTLMQLAEQARAA